MRARSAATWIKTEDDDGEIISWGTDDFGLLGLWPINAGNGLNVKIDIEFRGLVDDVRTYKRVLSDEEVMALFKLQIVRPSPESKK